MLLLLVLVGLMVPVLVGVTTRLKKKANARGSGLQLGLPAKRRAAPDLQVTSSHLPPDGK